jgi:hypothetical protein
MNVEIGTEAALFPEKEHISGIFLAVYWEPLNGDQSSQHWCFMKTVFTLLTHETRC